MRIRKLRWAAPAALAVALWGQTGGDMVRLRPLPKLDENMKTGPAIGARIPSFEAADQNGRTRNFENLRGSNGLVLLFVRSADW
jgi:hypothetical protein